MATTDCVKMEMPLVCGGERRIEYPHFGDRSPRVAISPLHPERRIDAPMNHHIRGTLRPEFKATRHRAVKSQGGGVAVNTA
jgi:hypothetical protein